MRIKADLTLLVVSILWGSAFVAQRVAGQLGSVYLFNGARYLLAALFVLPVAFRTRRAKDQAYLSRGQLNWMVVAGFLLFLGSAFQQAGLVYTSAGNAGFITSLYVVLIPLLLFLFWKERPHWLSITAVLSAGSGAFLLSTGGRFEYHAGDTLELFGALFWAFHVIVLGKFASKFEAISFSLGQLVVCGILNLLLGALYEEMVPLNRELVLAIVYTAFFSLGLSYTLQIWAQKHTPPADAALILGLESVFAVIAGWLLLDERLAAIQIFGCALIFIAVVMSQSKDLKSGTMGHDHPGDGIK